MIRHMSKEVIGNFETVSFPEFGIDNILAKMDTGADTGALHSTKIHELETKNGLVLEFAPFDHPDVLMSTAHYLRRTVKSSNGSYEQRYFIDTTIEISGKSYPITLSLSDRSTMRFPVLIGSKFLRENNFLVDVNLNNRGKAVDRKA